MVVTGPTGSGKFTTLYSTLGKLNDEERDIVTIDNPVEYRMESVTQPDPDKSPCMVHLRLSPQVHSAQRPGRGDGRRDPGLRDRRSFRRGRLNRAHGPYHLTNL